MSLVECRECKNLVSGEAKTCPNCGINAPNPEVFDLLSTASHFGVDGRDFAAYDPDTMESIRQNARNNLLQIGTDAALAEAKKDKSRYEIRRAIITAAVMIVLAVAFFTGMLNPILRYIMT